MSGLAPVEVASALWRKVRTGELDAEEANNLARQASRELSGEAELEVTTVAVTAPLLSFAATLTGRHGLRAYDAVQLATALAVRAADDPDQSFVCFDEDLRAAAAREGLVVLPTSAQLRDDDQEHDDQDHDGGQRARGEAGAR